MCPGVELGLRCGTLTTWVCGLFLCLVGCGVRQPPEAESDVAMRVHVERSWVRRQSQFSYSYHSLLEHTVGWEVDSGGGLIVAGLMLAVVGLTELTYNGIASSLSLAQETKLHVYPQGQPQLRRPLAWGDNVLHFPPNALQARHWVIEIAGDRVGVVILTHEEQEPLAFILR